MVGTPVHEHNCTGGRRRCRNVRTTKISTKARPTSSATVWPWTAGSDEQFNRGEDTIAGQKAINLALQGGGSHSAFTWGVLDRLLEDERLTFDGITATSAGSVNAVLLADGLALGGRPVAKELLSVFWKKMSDMTSSSIIASSFLDKLNPHFGLEHSPGYLFIDLITRFMSPYQLNPFDMNPMRDLLDEVIDFRRVRQQQAVKLYLCATTVRTGKIAVFTNKEITADH